MKKFLLFGLACACGLTAAAETGRVLTQDGYKLENVASYSAMTSEAALNVRAGVGVNGKFYVAKTGVGVLVYDESGLKKTITPPTGCYPWISITADQAGHVIARIDKKGAFPSPANPSTGGNHGFFVIDSETDEAITGFVPMTQASGARFDSMGPVEGNIFEKDARIFITPANVTYTYIFTYDNAEVTVQVPSTYSVTTAPDAAFAWTAKSYDGGILKDFSDKTQTSTAVSLQYNNGDNLAVYCNPQYFVAYSSEGHYGNAIRNYVNDFTTVEDKNGNVKTKLVPAAGDYFHTPTHSGLTGFNIFTLDGQQYIIYPHGINDPNSSVSAADAFAIAKVEFTDTPLTDMTAAGETIVDDKLAGNLVAVVRPAIKSNGGIMYTGNSACTNSYIVVPAEDEENSVLIYAYGAGAPGNIWKFTDLVDDIPTGVEGIEADTDAPVEYFNLQGVCVANPESGVYIRRQGAKTTKVIL